MEIDAVRDCTVSGAAAGGRRSIVCQATRTGINHHTWLGWSREGGVTGAEWGLSVDVRRKSATASVRDTYNLAISDEVDAKTSVGSRWVWMIRASG
jgi:hypothetical protein